MPRITTVKDCKLIHLESITSNRQGSITPIYNNIHIPFSIRRVYYLYDIPAGSKRGAHAHKDLQQLFIAGSGSFDVVLNDGKREKKFSMNQPSTGLYIPPMIWRELINFSGGGICLVLASLYFDENDYYRNFQTFIDQKWKC